MSKRDERKRGKGRQGKRKREERKEEGERGRERGREGNRSLCFLWCLLKFKGRSHLFRLQVIGLTPSPAMND